MKKILLIAFLLFSFKCFPAPSNTMSISPVAVAEATILADDENTRNNAVSTTYNAHSHTDIPSSSSNDFIVGDGQAGDKTLSIDNGDANSPSLKFDDTDDIWEAGNDGVNFYELILGNTDQTIAGDKTFSNIITGTLTDSTLTIQSGKITAAESITSGTFTDGTLTIQSGVIASANSITSNTLSDGTLTIQGGNIASANTITTTTLVVSDADINGGTMDGVNVGGETATGMLYVNDSSDDMDGLGDQGTSGQVLTSAGAGSNPTWTSIGVIKLSTTVMTNVNNSGDITITAGKKYMVFVVFTAVAADSNITMRFDSDDGSDYSWTLKSTPWADSPSTTLSGDLEDTFISLGEVDFETATTFSATLIFDATASNNTIYVHGDIFSIKADGTTGEEREIKARYLDAGTLTDFEIISSQTITGTVTTYEYQ